MKAISKLAMLMVIVSSASFATSLHPDTFREVANGLRKIEISEVEQLGKVLRVRRQHPYSTFLIGIPAKVGTGDACTTFVGQQITATRPQAPQLPTITALGARNPMTEACIEIFPMPVKTYLSIEMKVLTGGFVPAQPVQTMMVDIAGVGLHKLTLDMGSSEVKIDKVLR